jgi:hypothetical protein
MSDTWNALTATLYPDAAIRNGGFQLYSGLKGNVGVNAISNVGHSLQTTKLWYFEVNIFNLFPPADELTGVGIDTNSQGNSADNFVLFGDGTIWQAANQVHTITVPPTGLNGVVGVTAGNGQIWWQINGGPYNGSAGANPAKNIGGFTISAALVHWIYGAVGTNPTDGVLFNTADINTGPVFAYPPPVGAAAWAPIVAIGTGSPNPPEPNPISPPMIDTRPWHGQPTVG